MREGREWGWLLVLGGWLLAGRLKAGRLAAKLRPGSVPQDGGFRPDGSGHVPEWSASIPPLARAAFSPGDARRLGPNVVNASQCVLGRLNVPPGSKLSATIGPWLVF